LSILRDDSLLAKLRAGGSAVAEEVVDADEPTQHAAIELREHSDAVEFVGFGVDAVEPRGDASSHRS
jgi:hypothetical protein